MNLREVILKCDQYINSDEIIHVVFAKRINDSFDSLSEAKILKLTPEEMGMNLIDIKNSKCPEYDYFLEMDIIQNLFEDIKNMAEFKSDDKKVKRVIYFAEFDA